MSRSILTTSRKPSSSRPKKVIGVRVANTTTGDLMWATSANTLPNTNVFTISFWIRMSVMNASRIMQTNTGRFTLDSLALGRIDCNIYDSSPAKTLQSTSANGAIIIGTWHHVIMSVNSNAQIGGEVYIDDAVSVNATYPNFQTTTTAMNFEPGVNLRLFYDTDAVYDIAEFYLNPYDYLDLSDENNRRKFITADGKPVDLGTDGSWPTNRQPPIYLSGGASEFLVNKGSMGNPTGSVSPTITTATTSPSD